MTCSESDSTTEAPPIERYHVTPDQTPSEAVVTAVAEASGRAVAGGDGAEALDPLYDAIDPDALDTLFTTDGDDAGATAVEFVYEGYEVTVAATDLVTLRPVA
jgi:hypothetical protein